MACCPNLSRMIGIFVGLAIVGGFIVAMTDSASVADENSKKLRHIVMFKFKETSSEKEIANVVKEFQALPGKIPQISDFEFGMNNSPEELNDGFTHCFLVTFDSDEARGAYLPHKAHMAFVDVLKPHLDKVLVLDYWANE